MAVDSTITAIVSGGYGEIVKLDDDRIISIAQHLKETDDGGTDEIVAIARGAYPIMVKLDDGSVTSLAQHLLAKQEGGENTIDAIASGGYNDQILSGTDIGSVALKVIADEAGGGGASLEVLEDSSESSKKEPTGEPLQ